MTGITRRATLDRIVDGEHAVLLVEDDGGDVVDEFVVDVDDLPADGCHEGAVLEIDVDDGELVDGAYLPEETERRSDAAQDRLDRLSSPLSERTDREE